MGFARNSASCLAAGLVVLTASSAAFAALESHRAAYRLKLDRSQRMSGLSGVDGGLVIEWRRACDGWLSHQRLGFIAATDGGPNFSHDVRFSSWEAADGSEMRYSVRSFDGDRLREEYMGSARVDPDDGGGTASFTKPDEREITLPPGTVFPADHFNRLLSEAGSGTSFISHEVFDGWGYEALTQVTSVIGQARPYEPSDEQELHARPDADAWPVTMAYYSLNARERSPRIRGDVHADRGRRAAGSASRLRRFSPAGDAFRVRASGRSRLLTPSHGGQAATSSPGPCQPQEHRSWPAVFEEKPHWSPRQARASAGRPR